MGIGEWRLNRVLRVWQPGYNLHLRLELPALG